MASAHPLGPLVDAEGDPAPWRRGGRVRQDLVHGEARQLASDFKHVELGAAVKVGGRE